MMSFNDVCVSKILVVQGMNNQRVYEGWWKERDSMLPISINEIDFISEELDDVVCIRTAFAILGDGESNIGDKKYYWEEKEAKKDWYEENYLKA